MSLSHNQLGAYLDSWNERIGIEVVIQAADHDTSRISIIDHEGTVIRTIAVSTPPHKADFIAQDVMRLATITNLVQRIEGDAAQVIFDEIKPGDRVYYQGLNEGWYVVSDIDDEYVALDGLDLSQKSDETPASFIDFGALEGSMIEYFHPSVSSERQKELHSFPTVNVYSVDIRLSGDKAESLETVLVADARFSEIDADSKIPGQLESKDIFFYGMRWKDLLEVMYEGTSIEGWTVERINGRLCPDAKRTYPPLVLKPAPFAHEQDWQDFCRDGEPGFELHHFDHDYVVYMTEDTRDFIVERIPQGGDNLQDGEELERFETAGEVEHYFADPRNFFGDPDPATNLREQIIVSLDNQNLNRLPQKPPSLSDVRKELANAPTPQAASKATRKEMER